MLILNCPYCGRDKDETELAAGGEAHITRFGCGKWFHAARCTATLEVFGTYKAQTIEPPQVIKDAITAKRPGWSWRNFS
jgi:sarcosine oxidase subunit delta